MEKLIEAYCELDMFQKSMLWLTATFAIVGLIRVCTIDLIKNTLADLISEILYSNIPILCFILFFIKLCVENKENFAGCLICLLGILAEMAFIIISDIKAIKIWKMEKNK